MADVYTKRQAESIYNNQLPKALRTIFRVEQVKTVPTTTSKTVKVLSSSDIKNNTEQVMNTEYAQKWLNNISTLSDIVSDAKGRRDLLKAEQKIVDGQIQDELHYIEFAKCNAYQGWLSWKRLQTLRQKRRSIKNELSVLDTMLNKQVCNVNVADIRKEIEKLDDRHYSPRVLNELYED